AHETAHDLLRLRLLEIEGDRLLVARLGVPPQRRAFVQLAPLAQRIAAPRGLDLDHLGAELGQHARAERPGDERAELDHPHAAQRKTAVPRHDIVLLRPSPGADTAPDVEKTLLPPVMS